MAEPIEYRRIRQKVDTYDNWMANPLILGDGEQAFVRGGGVVLNFRMGDGTKRFSELPNVIQYDQAAYVAAVGNTLPVPQNGVGYSILSPGSYNGGDLVVPPNNIGIASYSGSWTVRNMELNLDISLNDSSPQIDLSFSDNLGNDIVQFLSGGIKTKKFDSEKASFSEDSNPFDFSIQDESGNSAFIVSGGDIITGKFDSRKIYRKSVKIIIWGNSFSRDTFMYVPFLLEEMGVKDVVIGILYASGATLQYNWLNRGVEVYNMDIYKSSIGSWSTSAGRTARYGLELENWDIVVLQQQSVASRTYSTYQPHLNNLVNYVCEVVQNSCAIKFNMIPAAPFTGAWDAPGVTSDQFFEQQVACYEIIKNQTAIDGFFFGGTAIQNARQTRLSEVGNNLTAPDQVHLNEGLPCLIAAYGNVMALKDTLSLPKSIYGSKIRPTQEWVVEKNIIEPHGTSIGITEDNVVLAQKCAVMSYKFPFQISQIEF